MTRTKSACMPASGSSRGHIQAATMLHYETGPLRLQMEADGKCVPDSGQEAGFDWFQREVALRDDGGRIHDRRGPVVQ
ncbi:MAG: hypothetical protein DME21_12515 [Verrucomicrobia bacterium]|nr:MAG: hypothetical protein DME21_12515 [Verrucomicrobiota bacterium]